MDNLWSADSKTIGMPEWTCSSHTYFVDSAYNSYYFKRQPDNHQKD